MFLFLDKTVFSKMRSTVCQELSDAVATLKEHGIDTINYAEIGVLRNISLVGDYHDSAAKTSELADLTKRIWEYVLVVKSFLNDAPDGDYWYVNSMIKKTSVVSLTVFAKNSVTQLKNNIESFNKSAILMGAHDKQYYSETEKRRSTLVSDVLLTTRGFIVNEKNNLDKRAYLKAADALISLYNERELYDNHRLTTITHLMCDEEHIVCHGSIRHCGYRQVALVSVHDLKQAVQSGSQDVVCVTANSCVGKLHIGNAVIVTDKHLALLKELQKVTPTELRSLDGVIDDATYLMYNKPKVLCNVD